MTRIISAAAVTALLAAPAGAAITAFDDLADWRASVGTAITEDFDGARTPFPANSTGNAVGAFATVDILGTAGGDADPGLTGGGFLEGAVSDRPGSPLSIAFSFTAPVRGFALAGFQDNNVTTPVNVAELGVVVDGERVLLSDVLGLTDSSGGNPVATTNTGAFAVGFLGDAPITGFEIVHGNTVAPGGVIGRFEAFWIDELQIAPVPAVPLPAGAPALLGGLAALGLAARGRRR